MPQTLLWKSLLNAHTVIYNEGLEVEMPQRKTFTYEMISSRRHFVKTGLMLIGLSVDPADHNGVHGAKDSEAEWVCHWVERLLSASRILGLRLLGSFAARRLPNHL